MGKAAKRNSYGLENLLWDQLESLIEGEITPQHARASSSLVSQIIAVTRIKMDFSRFVSDARSDGGVLKQIPMGTIGSD